MQRDSVTFIKTNTYKSLDRTQVGKEIFEVCRQLDSKFLMYSFTMVSMTGESCFCKATYHIKILIAVLSYIMLTVTVFLDTGPAPMYFTRTSYCSPGRTSSIDQIIDVANGKQRGGEHRRRCATVYCIGHLSVPLWFGIIENLYVDVLYGSRSSTDIFPKYFLQNSKLSLGVLDQWKLL